MKLFIKKTPYNKPAFRRGAFIALFNRVTKIRHKVKTLKWQGTPAGILSKNKILSTGPNISRICRTSFRDFARIIFIALRMAGEPVRQVRHRWCPADNIAQCM